MVGKSKNKIKSKNIVNGHNCDDPYTCQNPKCKAIVADTISKHNEWKRLSRDLYSSNGEVNQGPWQGEPCWDKCVKKGWCEAGVGGVCDREYYCHPANDDRTAQDVFGTEKQYCSPPLTGGRSKKRKSRKKKKRKSRKKNKRKSRKKKKRKSRKKKGGGFCGRIQNCHKCVTSTTPNAKPCLWNKNKNSQPCRRRNWLKRRTEKNGWLNSCPTNSLTDSVPTAMPSKINNAPNVHRSSLTDSVPTAMPFEGGKRKNTKHRKRRRKKKNTKKKKRKFRRRR